MVDLFHAIAEGSVTVGQVQVELHSTSKVLGLFKHHDDSLHENRFRGGFHTPSIWVGVLAVELTFQIHASCFVLPAITGCTAIPEHS